MGNCLSYKGYEGSVEFSSEDNCLYGKVLGIRSLVSFEGASLYELKRDFEASVDDYLESCKELGWEPDRPYKGSFNVRIGPELHRALDIEAQKRNCSLNALIKTILTNQLANS